MFGMLAQENGTGVAPEMVQIIGYGCDIPPWCKRLFVISYWFVMALAKAGF